MADENGSATEATPRLRFPEFRKAVWGKARLGAALRFQTGYPFPSSGFNEEGTGLRLIRNRDLRSNEKIIFFDGDYDETYVVNDGDVLVGMDGDFTPSVWFQGRALLNQRVGRVRPNDGYDQRFFLYFLDLHLRKIEESTARTTVKHLSHTDVEKLEEPIPSVAEQKKIADCLTSLDELIAAQGRQVAALADHKRGLMQQLFPREGETRPRFRFAEFRNAEEWQVKPLSLVAENLDNKRVPVTEKDRTKGDVPYYGASGIVDYVEDHIFDEDLLCVSEDGANLVARTYPIAFAISGRTWVNNHAHVLRFENTATQKIVESYLNSIDLGDFITGMAQPKLNRAMLDRILIPLPEPVEQQSIAACLSTLDAQITAASEKLTALKVHKQGLMQQLFPTSG